jgi:hypothetical protein
MFFGDSDGDRASSLHREATKLNDAGDVDGAITLLREAKTFLERSSVGFGDATWDRLPRLLQRVGRFDEAMAEFDYLIADLPRRARNAVAMDDPSVRYDDKDRMMAEFIDVHRRLIWMQRRTVQIREIKRLRRLQKPSKSRSKPKT